MVAEPNPAAEPFQTVRYPHDHPVTAPDGSLIHQLSRTQRGSFAHCTLAPGATSAAVRHRTVDEIWYCTAGSGEVWRRTEAGEEIVTFVPGTSLSIHCGTAFQFRTTSATPLKFVLVTMPPWPGDGEVEFAEGAW